MINAYQRRQAKEKGRSGIHIWIELYMLGASFIDDFPSLLLYSRNFSFSSQCVCSEQQQQQQEQRAPMRLSSYEILLIEAHQLLYWIFNYDAINNANREFSSSRPSAFRRSFMGFLIRRRFVCGFENTCPENLFMRWYRWIFKLLFDPTFSFWCAPLVSTRHFRRRRSTERAF